MGFLMWERGKAESSIMSMQCRAKQPRLLKDWCQKTDFSLCQQVSIPKILSKCIV